MRWILIMFAVGCNDGGWYEDSPVDQGHTRYHAIASVDGEHLAVALEPRFVHREEHGVLTTGYTTRLTGPTVIVDSATDAVTATLAVGRSRVVVGATRAWVLQQPGDQWTTHLPPIDEGPIPYDRAAVLDRTTLAVTAQAVLDPPLDTPVVVADDLLDVTASGASDVARDITVRLRDDTGGATVLHAGRGFGSAWCTGDAALALAYQRADALDSLRIVVLRRDPDGWHAATSDLAGVHLGASGIACDRAVGRLAIDALSTADHLPELVIDDLAAQHADSVAGITGPLAMRGDGGAVVGIRVSDQMLVEASGQNVAPLGVISARSPGRPQVVADQALFDTTDGPRVIDLAVGGASPPLHAIDVLPWPGVGGFAVVHEDTTSQLDMIGIATAAGTSPLPLPEPRLYPRDVAAAGTRLYIVAYPTADAPAQLIAYDAHAVLATLPLPVCDAAQVLAGGPCR